MKLRQQVVIIFLSVIIPAAQMYGMDHDEIFAVQVLSALEQIKYDQPRRENYKAELDNQIAQATQMWLKDSSKKNCDAMAKAMWQKEKFVFLSQHELCDEAVISVDLQRNDLESETYRIDWSSFVPSELGLSVACAKK